MDSGKRAHVPQVAAVVPKAGLPSKTHVGKTMSEASMTPSQFAAAEAAKARKHPLDALSRSVFSRGHEKRSGLQDVDDEFLKQNFFAKPGFGRHSGLNDVNLYNNNMHQAAAGQPSGLMQNAINQGQAQAQMGAQQVPIEGSAQMHYVSSQAAPMQPPQQQQVPPGMQQTMQQPPAAQNQVPMNNGMPAAGQPSGMASNAALHAQSPQGSVQPPLGGQNSQLHVSPSQQSQQPQIPVSPSQANAMAAAQQQQQQMMAQPPQQPPVQNIPQQQQMHQPPPLPPQQEPDMCTTCPNCQTTIYLVRPDAQEMQQMQQMQQVVN